MRTAILLYALFILPVFSEEDWRIENRKMEAKQVDLWVNNLLASSDMDDIGKLELLSVGLKSMAYWKTMSDDGQKVNELFQKIQDSMLKIPGHAEYFRDRILKARLKYEKVKGGASLATEAEFRSDLSSVQTSSFRTLAYLPSCETVRVLGEFLSDDRGYTKLPPIPTLDELEVAQMEAPNCVYAAQSLSGLPLLSKPVQKEARLVDYEEVRTWQIWYEQIKAGNRTFRFEGDPTEYDLNGPAPKEKLQRIERDRKRDAERLAGHRKSSSNPNLVSQALRMSRAASVIGVIAAGVLAALAAWYLLRMRRMSGVRN